MKRFHLDYDRAKDNVSFYVHARDGDHHIVIRRVNADEGILEFITRGNSRRLTPPTGTKLLTANGFEVPPTECAYKIICGMGYEMTIGGLSVLSIQPVRTHGVTVFNWVPGDYSE